MSQRLRASHFAVLSLLLALGLLCPPARLLAQELTKEDWSLLDTFEAHSLSKADQLLAQKQYRVSAAAYESFAQEFPKSKAMPYVLLRHGMSLQLDNKRYEAIRVYNEVLDYFPNAVPYAGAALFYIGQSYAQSGDIEKALKAWREMADDADYRKHSLAAGALNGLADNLLKMAKASEAGVYYAQVAVEFRTRNPEAARYGIEHAVSCYVREAPSEPKLRELYDKAKSFNHDPGIPSEDNYWGRTRQFIRQYGSFAEDQKEQRERYYRYWVGVMEGKRPGDDGFQIDLNDFKLVVDGEKAKWSERLDAQFARGAQDDYGRVIQWISVYKGNKKKIDEYYGKLNFGKMKNPQIISLVKTLFDPVGDGKMAHNAFGYIRPAEMSEPEKSDLERFLWYHDGMLVEQTCAMFADKSAGSMELLRFYGWTHNAAKGVPIADEMTKEPRFAKEAYSQKGELLYDAGKPAEAIQAFQAADSPPQTSWRIADCYVAMKKSDQAVTTYREIENFFADQAPEAALRIAHLYRGTNLKDKYVAELRSIMKKYPKSSQSNLCHEELEVMGYKIGGGVDAQ